MFCPDTPSFHDCIWSHVELSSDLQTQDDANAFQCAIGYATSLYLVMYTSKIHYNQSHQKCDKQSNRHADITSYLQFKRFKRRTLAEFFPHEMFLKGRFQNCLTFLWMPPQIIIMSELFDLDYCLYLFGYNKGKKLIA